MQGAGGLSAVPCLNPVVQQLRYVHPLEALIGNRSHSEDIWLTSDHLCNGVFGIHRPNRLDAAAIRVAVEHRVRRHANRGKWCGPRCEECDPALPIGPRGGKDLVRLVGSAPFGHGSSRSLGAIAKQPRVYCRLSKPWKTAGSSPAGPALVCGAFSTGMD